MSLTTPTQNGPQPVPESPRRARWRRALAAESSPGPALSPRSSSPGPEGNHEDVERSSSPATGDKHGRDDDDDEEGNILSLSRSVRRRPINSLTADNSWRDLSYLVAPATKDHKFSTVALARIQRYARAPNDERAFLSFVNTEVIMTNFKDAAEDWEIALQLKSLLKARIAACILSPHIPEYKRSLVKHVTALLPPSAMHMLPDAGNSSHKKILNTFTGDYATSARNIVKTAIVKSMTRFDLEAGDDLLDVTQGWCIGKLCEEIVAKLGTDADIQVTSEVQGRVALLRFVFAAYPAKASGSQYWDLVDETLSSQRELSAAVMARDIAEGLKDDIKKYTGESWETYTLVDTKAVASDSLQACADKAMRDYYKTVKPLKKTVRAGGGK